jgi:uncharacterized protein (DUF433 family)
MRKIVSDPRVLGGKPVLEGTRMSVEQVLGLIAKGMSVGDVVDAYPNLAEDDVRGVFSYAQAALRNDVVLDVPGS